MAQDQLLLDDGEFNIKLNGNYDSRVAPGFLNHRCSCSMSTPMGFECIGSFDRSLGGTWNASINVPYDPKTDGDSRIVVEGVSRMDAIVALWAARASAFTAHT